MLSAQEVTLSAAVASSLACVSDGYRLFFISGVFGNSAVHLQIHECLPDLLFIPLPVNTIFPALKLFG